MSDSLWAWNTPEMDPRFARELEDDLWDWAPSTEEENPTVAVQEGMGLCRAAYKWHDSARELECRSLAGAA